MNINIPNKIDSEKSVLGAMFLDQEALAKSCDLLTHDSFYDEKNKIIFEAIKSMYNEKIPIDIITLTSRLKDKKILDKIGGVSYISNILSIVPSASNIDYYIKDIEEARILRKLIDVTGQIKDLAFSTDKKIEDILDESESKILNIARNRRSKDFKTVTEVLKKAEENINFLTKNKNEVTRISTGFLDFDKYTTGLKEGQLIIVAGRPGIGKTVVATNLASNIAINSKKTVALFNLEMGAEQLINRMIASVGGIDQHKLQTGYFSESDWNKFTKATAELGNAKIYFDDTPSLSIGELKSKCRKLASSEEGLDVIIIDYLQILTSNKNYQGNRQQEVADISRSLKQLALELKVPIIALAQLRRPIEAKKGDQRPTMNELRESGQIEQDADIIVLLYREDYVDKTKAIDNNTTIMEFNLEKNRNGVSGRKIELLYNKNLSRLLNKGKEINEAS